MTRKLMHCEARFRFCRFEQFESRQLLSAMPSAPATVPVWTIPLGAIELGSAIKIDPAGSGFAGIGGDSAIRVVDVGGSVMVVTNGYGQYNLADGLDLEVVPAIDPLDWSLVRAPMLSGIPLVPSDPVKLPAAAPLAPPSALPQEPGAATLTVATQVSPWGPALAPISTSSPSQIFTASAATETVVASGTAISPSPARSSATGETPARFLPATFSVAEEHRLDVAPPIASQQPVASPRGGELEPTRVIWQTFCLGGECARRVTLKAESQASPSAKSASDPETARVDAVMQDWEFSATQDNRMTDAVFGIDDLPDAADLAIISQVRDFSVGELRTVQAVAQFAAEHKEAALVALCASAMSYLWIRAADGRQPADETPTELKPRRAPRPAAGLRQARNPGRAPLRQKVGSGLEL